MHGDIDQQLFTPYFYSRVACCGIDGGPMLQETVGYGDHTIDLRITTETCSCDLNATYGAARVPANRSFAACAASSRTFLSISCCLTSSSAAFFRTDCLSFVLLCWTMSVEVCWTEAMISYATSKQSSHLS